MEAGSWHERKTILAVDRPDGLAQYGSQGHTLDPVGLILRVGMAEGEVSHSSESGFESLQSRRLSTSSLVLYFLRAAVRVSNASMGLVSIICLRSL